MLQVGFVRAFDALPSSSLSSVVLTRVVHATQPREGGVFCGFFAAERPFVHNTGRERDAALPRAQGSCGVDLSPEVW